MAKKSGWIGALACTGVLLGAGVEAQTPTTVEQLDDLVAHCARAGAGSSGPRGTKVRDSGPGA